MAVQCNCSDLKMAFHKFLCFSYSGENGKKYIIQVQDKGNKNHSIKDTECNDQAQIFTTEGLPICPVFHVWSQHQLTQETKSAQSIGFEWFLTFVGSHMPFVTRLNPDSSRVDTTEALTQHCFLHTYGQVWDETPVYWCFCSDTCSRTGRELHLKLFHD